jgi:hypothetical protein
MRPYDPWEALRDFPAVVVVETDLPPGRRGQVQFSTRVISLARGLAEVERTCTLAHELVHLERGPVMHRQTVREERTVAAIAARRLVPLEVLAEAFRWSSDVHEVADELGVDARTVRVRVASLTADERRRLADLHGAPANT